MSGDRLFLDFFPSCFTIFSILAFFFKFVVSWLEVAIIPSNAVYIQDRKEIDKALSM